MARRNSLRGNDQMQLTPMIDIMSTLLAVFMVTTPMLTNGIDLDLPSAGQSIPTSSEHAMVISVDKLGNYYLSEKKMDLEKIILRLASMRNENPKMLIVIAGDKNADYGAVMRAMGGLKETGFESVILKTASIK